MNVPNRAIPRYIYTPNGATVKTKRGHHYAAIGWWDITHFNGTTTPIAKLLGTSDNLDALKRRASRTGAEHRIYDLDAIEWMD